MGHAHAAWQHTTDRERARRCALMLVDNIDWQSRFYAVMNRTRHPFALAFVVVGARMHRSRRTENLRCPVANAA